MNGMNEKLLNCLSVDNYITAGKLGKQLLFSDRTIRNYIKELDMFLQQHGAHIEMKNGKGYRLAIDNEQLFGSIYKNGILKNDDAIPTSIEERVDFIIAYLLCHDNYVQFDELMSILCISESTLMADLRRTRIFMSEYNVKLEIRTKKGIRAVGTEFDLRAALANYVMKRGIIAGSEFHMAELEKKKIFSIIMDSLSELDISMSEISVQNLTIDLYVAVKRIKSNRPINIPAKIHDELLKKFAQGVVLAKRICERIEAVFHVQFSDEEMDYVIIYLAGNRVIRGHLTEADNIVVSPAIRELIDNMLQYIYITMKVDLRNNFSLIMALSKHLVALEVRIKYNMSLKNPILDEIKQNFSKAYVIAAQSVIILQNYYGKKIREDEIGYLAIIFDLYLEGLNAPKKEVKKNVLIVCAMGKASARLLAYQYRKTFGNYLNKIEVCNRSNLNHFNFNGFDYILTTTPISLKVPIPIIEIKMFLDDRDINYLTAEFAKDTQGNREIYYSKELFFHKKAFDTKEEVIRYMCNEIAEWQDVPADFCESVILRESYGSTDFAEMVAMPHPYGQVTKESFAAVCILDEPVYWGNHHVQMVILVSLSHDEEPDRDIFFEQTTEFIMNKEKVKEALANPIYEKFIQLIQSE